MPGAMETNSDEDTHNYTTERIANLRRIWTKFLQFFSVVSNENQDD